MFALGTKLFHVGQADVSRRALYTAKGEALICASAKGLKRPPDGIVGVGLGALDETNMVERSM